MIKSLDSDSEFVSMMSQELAQQLSESQAETEKRWNGSSNDSPAITWSEFAGNFN